MHQQSSITERRRVTFIDFISEMGGIWAAFIAILGAAFSVINYKLNEIKILKEY